MRILLSNDDGVTAPGLAALVDILSDIADIDVVAPDRNRSGASNSLTLDSPLRTQVLHNGFVSLNGTPTDCVHLALTGYLKHRPDLVVSGINEGPNLGDDVLYSGTVAAATEASMLGIPAIAISLAAFQEGCIESAAKIARQLVEKVQKDPLPSTAILNVNVPNLPLDKIVGFEVVRLGRRHPANPMLKAKDAHGKLIYWVGPPGEGADAGPGTDFYSIKTSHVSITPIQVDLTHYSAFDRCAKWTHGITVE